MNWKLIDIKKLADQGRVVGYDQVDRVAKKKVKKNKYRNKKVIIDGITFDSEKEGNRYNDLKILVTAGVISDLRLQVPYQLNKGGTHSVKYVADFVYIDSGTGEEIIEDTKGHRTKEYKRKRKLMKKVLGIIIKET